MSPLQGLHRTERQDLLIRFSFVKTKYWFNWEILSQILSKISLQDHKVLFTRSFNEKYIIFVFLINLFHVYKITAVWDYLNP